MMTFDNLTEPLPTDNSSDSIPYCAPFGYPTVQAALRVGGNAPLVIVGTGFNIANMLVFSDARMRRNMINWFLLALAALDQLLLVCNCFMLVLPVTAENLLADATTVTLSNRLTRWTFPVGNYARTGVVYVTVTLSLYRYFGLCRPFWAQTMVTARRVWLAIIGSIIFSIVFTIPRWFELSTSGCRVNSVTSAVPQTSVNIVQTNFGASEPYALYYKVIACTMVVFVLPFAVLVFTNIRIFCALKTSQRVRRKMTRSAERSVPLLKNDHRKRSRLASQSEPTPRRQFDDVNDGQCGSTTSLPSPLLRSRQLSPLIAKRETNVTLMLLTILSLFIVCNSLSFLINCLEIAMVHFGALKTVFSKRTFMVLVELSNILITFNSAANLPIYYMFSVRFRARLAAIFSCCRDNVALLQKAVIIPRSSLMTTQTLSPMPPTSALYATRLLHPRRQSAMTHITKQRNRTLFSQLPVEKRNMLSVPSSQRAHRSNTRKCGAVTFVMTYDADCKISEI